MKTLTSTFISFIIKYEFESFLRILREDFKENYEKKKHNFIISGLNNTNIGYLSFVSSFESKYGNVMERIATKITKLKYGNTKVPSIINPHNLDFEITDKIKKLQQKSNQIIVTNLNIEDKKVIGKIASFRTEFQSKGRGKNKILCKINQRKIKQLLKMNDLSTYKNDEIKVKPVDLAFYDEDNILNILELKAGGNLDSSNGPKNIEKLLTIYSAVNDKNAKVFFATLYNKDGEGNEWNGNAKKYLKYPEMFLIGKVFWDKILPTGISFEYFQIIYQSVLKELNIDNYIDTLIKTVSERPLNITCQFKI